jgi:hypothetical protein
VFCYTPFSSDDTASEAVKEQGDLSVPPGGCSTTSQDVESSPVSTSTNENSPLPSNESTSATPQASPSSSVPSDGGETHARKMGRPADPYAYLPVSFFYVLVLHVFMRFLQMKPVHGTVAEYGWVQVIMPIVCVLGACLTVHGDFEMTSRTSWTLDKWVSFELVLQYVETGLVDSFQIKVNVSALAWGLVCR